MPQREEVEDMDGDGYGDNPDGENQMHSLLTDEWQDPGTLWAITKTHSHLTLHKQSDSDGDGFGDNPMGNGADRFQRDSLSRGWT